MQALSFTVGEVNKLPDRPGIYSFFSKNNHRIYVGKAKNLKKRVASYFQHGGNQGRKTKKLISETVRIEITIVNSEFDALLLENALIKENQPKYNILLKDDKTFPFISVTNERFPRVISTRKVNPGSGRYFGPYASVRAMKNVLDLIRNLYHVRTCKLVLTENNIRKKKFKICLEYHIGKCKGPCEGLQQEEEYNYEIDQVLHILKGDLKPVSRYFETQMQENASRLEFEKAEESKQRLLLLDKFQSKSIIVSPSITNIDIVTILSDDKNGYINYLKIHNGTIHQTLNIEVRKKLEETEQEILALWIIELRSKFNSNAKEILSNIVLENDLGVPVHVPQRGDKRKLVDLSLKNALYYKKEKSAEDKPDLSANERILMKLKDDLQLKSMPRQIEGFDNSNIQGHHPVASMVCFKDGKPSKKNYRKFNIRTVTGPDDFASMEEIVYRRYKRVLEEKEPLPDLIVIDGGKGQLNAALQALKDLNLYGAIPVIGIAKRLEEIYFPDDEIPVHIDKKSTSLKLLQHIRNEAHRFAISFHLKKRQDHSLDSELDHIRGIGPATKKILLNHFRSIKNIRSAPIDDLNRLIGNRKTAFLIDGLKKEVSK